MKLFLQLPERGTHEWHAQNAKQIPFMMLHEIGCGVGHKHYESIKGCDDYLNGVKRDLKDLTESAAYFFNLEKKIPSGVGYAICTMRYFIHNTKKQFGVRLWFYNLYLKFRKIK